jgi:predicted lipid-binding transport protein (Tim44 family)
MVTPATPAERLAASAKALRDTARAIADAGKALGEPAPPAPCFSEVVGAAIGHVLGTVIRGAAHGMALAAFLVALFFGSAVFVGIGEIVFSGDSNNERAARIVASLRPAPLD